MKKTRLIPIALLVTLMLFSCATTGKESVPVKEEITITEAEAPRSEDTPEVVEPKEERQQKNVQYVMELVK